MKETAEKTDNERYIQQREGIIVSENCIHPAEIQEGDLVAFVDGLANDQVVQHILRCPACAQEVAELTALQSSLTAHLHRLSCPSAEQLFDYQHDEIGDNERLVVGLHLRQCPYCAHELASLVHEERKSRLDQVREMFQVLTAALVSRQWQAAGVRGPERGPLPIPQVYRAGKVEVIVSQRPSHSHPQQQDLSGLVHVEGQIPEAIGGSKAELYWDEGLIAITEINARGQFTFETLDAATYDLILLWGNREIRLQGVSVG